MLTLRHSYTKSLGITLACALVVGSAALTNANANATTPPDGPASDSTAQMPTAAMATAPIELVYEFYAAGLQLATIRTTATFTGDSYTISSKGQSSGIADTLVRARFESEVTGTLEAQGPRPHTFRNFSDTRWGVRELKMTLGEDGVFAVSADPELEPGQAAALRSGMATGTIDPLTATLYSALSPMDAACTEKQKVFDGRRVFTLAYSRLGTEVLEPGNAAVFAGETVKCHLKYLPLAGQSREWKLEQARNPTPPISIWMAAFDRTGPVGGVVLPVRMQIATDWGTAFAHLQSVKIGDTPIMQASIDAAQQAVSASSAP